MPDQQHSPEPWTIQVLAGQIGIFDSSTPRNQLVVEWSPTDTQTEDDVMESLANARRIVACVNACRHLPTEFLEQWAEGLDAVGLTLAREHVPSRQLKLERK